MARFRPQIKSQGFCFFSQLSELTLLRFVGIISSTPFPVRGVVFFDVVDNFCQLLGGGGGGCGRWRSWLWPARVYSASGEKRLRDSWGWYGDSGPPCARRDWRDFAPVDCPWRAFCHR